MTTLITKTQLMASVVAGLRHESFEHSIDGLFDITAMRQKCAAEELGERAILPLDGIIPFIRENRVIEMQRVLALDYESWKNDPGMFIVESYDDAGVPTGIMVDGHHRAIRRQLEGEMEMVVWMVPKDKAIRPGANWMRHPDDWGDAIIDGKIVKRT
jgi:hypothetical protein